MFRGGREPQVGTVIESSELIKIVIIMMTIIKVLKGYQAEFEHSSCLQCRPEAAGVFGSSSPQENQDPDPG